MKDSKPTGQGVEVWAETIPEVRASLHRTEKELSASQNAKAAPVLPKTV